jgi:6-pyruvoyltetrahydropterin/6-carboxytetrahydropterin synthase
MGLRLLGALSFNALAAIILTDYTLLHDNGIGSTLGFICTAVLSVAVGIELGYWLSNVGTESSQWPL